MQYDRRTYPSTICATTMKKIASLLFVVAAVLMAVIYTQITIFVLPRIGALPEGRTVIITRIDTTNFIDSPDAMCERYEGGVSRMCRATILGADGEGTTIFGKKTTILLRLPYSSWLYSISTGGKTYDR
jgi:hypothetical protein